MNQGGGVTQKSFWQRVGSAYQTVALIVFNTMILLVVVLVAITIFTPAKDTAAEASNGNIAAIGLNAPYSTYFDKNAYYLSTPEEVNAMLADYDAMARAGHWMVHPWTGLTMRPFQSDYLNIDNNGLRKGVPVNNTYADKTPLIVWAFGGSTLFGWGLGDAFSIPSQLQVDLQKRLPDRQIKVVNFAVPLYNSSQELALFAANLRDSKPDMAFFFDGINDLWYTLNKNTQTPLVEPLAAIWEQNTYEITHPQQGNWLTINPSFPPLRLAQLLGIHFGQQATSDADIQYAMRGIYKPTHDELLATAVHNYAANQQMAAAIGSALGVKTFFFLQPYLADTVDFPQFRTQLTQQNSISNYYDISTVLDGKLPGKRKALIDDFHYSDYASELLASRLADILLRPAQR